MFKCHTYFRVRHGSQDRGGLFRLSGFNGIIELESCDVVEAGGVGLIGSGDIISMPLVFYDFDTCSSKLHPPFSVVNVLNTIKQQMEISPLRDL